MLRGKGYHKVNVRFLHKKAQLNISWAQFMPKTTGGTSCCIIKKQAYLSIPVLLVLFFVFYLYSVI